MVLECFQSECCTICGFIICGWFWVIGHNECIIMYHHVSMWFSGLDFLWTIVNRFEFDNRSVIHMIMVIGWMKNHTNSMSYFQVLRWFNHRFYWLLNNDQCLFITDSLLIVDWMMIRIVMMIYWCIPWFGSYIWFCVDLASIFIAMITFFNILLCWFSFLRQIVYRN